MKKGIAIYYIWNKWDIHISEQSSNKVKIMFFEDAEEFLKSNDILFDKNQSFPSKGGIIVQFDIYVPTNIKGKLMQVIGNSKDLNKSKLLTMNTRILQGNSPNTDYIVIIGDISIKFTEEKSVKENTDSKIILFRLVL